ncbi:hypothetical protein PHMEG_00038548 [Phytophthora megakarya]|uniref:Uncharacterized protein n=1 Tax=Phytophthora megakarya TaxID=4795 RepID=A0A225UHE1_9STRA|nr:hypothetical protein PHMEG_00038548 [Phytophthora megakarya]
MIRKETPFYLAHGWDDHTILRTMTTSLKRDCSRDGEKYQAVEKARRAKIHNEKLSRKEQAAVPKM